MARSQELNIKLKAQFKNLSTAAGLFPNQKPRGEVLSESQNLTQFSVYSTVYKSTAVGVACQILGLNPQIGRIQQA
jgi:hypothetical protein